MNCGLSHRDLDLMGGVFQRHPKLAEVKLFGSRALGTHRPSSDIDLAVWGLDEMEGQRLASDLDELPLPYKFDVISMATLPHAPLREHIEDVGQTLYRAEVRGKTGAKATLS